MKICRDAIMVSPRVGLSALNPSTLPSQGEGNILSPGNMSIDMVMVATKKARAASPTLDKKP